MICVITDTNVVLIRGLVLLAMLQVHMALKRVAKMNSWPWAVVIAYDVLDFVVRALDCLVHRILASTHHNMNTKFQTHGMNFVRNWPVKGRRRIR